MWELACSTCGGTGFSPIPEICNSCLVCGGSGHFLFDDVVPSKTFNAVLEILRGLPSYEGAFAEELVFASEEVGVPNIPLLKQYLKDHWGRGASLADQNAWYDRHFWEERWYG